MEYISFGIALVSCIGSLWQYAKARDAESHTLLAEDSCNFWKDACSESYKDAAAHRRKMQAEIDRLHHESQTLRKKCDELQAKAKRPARTGKLR